MKAVKHALDDGLIGLDITATAAEVDREFEESRSQFAFDMRLRPEGGKSLDQIARERLGVNDLDAAVAPQVVQRLVPYALDKHDICPIALPACEYGTPPVRGRAFKFFAKVKPKPSYELPSYDPVKIRVDAFAFDESLVDDKLAHITDRFVEFVATKPRPVQDKDNCFLRMTACVDGKPVERLNTDGRVYSLGKGYLPHEFDEQLLGMVPGEKRHVRFEGPNPNGSDTTCEYECDVELIELRERHVPSLADEWVAQHVDGYDTLAELRAATRSELEQAERLKYEKEIVHKLVEKVSERFEGDIDEDAFDATYNAVLADLKSSVRLQGKDFLEYVKDMGGEEQVDLAISVRAREHLAQDYSLDALFVHYGLKIEEQDYWEAALELNPTDPASVRDLMERTGRGFALREVASRHRAARWLKDNSTVEYVAEGGE